MHASYYASNSSLSHKSTVMMKQLFTSKNDPFHKDDTTKLPPSAAVVVEDACAYDSGVRKSVLADILRGITLLRIICLLCIYG